MYSKYTYVANVTQANILSDIVAILTGTTDKTTLSAGCDKANTDILTTYDAAGWTVHDAAAGVNKVCIKAPCKDDVNQFKYVVIDANSAGYVMLTPYESWNAGTHTGTNMCSGSNTSSIQQRYSTVASGAMYISASNRRILMYGSSGVGAGCSNNGAPTMVLECDTGFSWCGAGQGYVPMIFGTTTNSDMTMPRHLGKNGSVYSSGSSTGLILASTFGAVSASSDNNLGNGAPMAGGAWATPVSPLFIGGGFGASSPMVSGISLTDMYFTTGGALFLDEIPYKGKTYLAIPIGTAVGRFMVPKG